MSYSSFVERLAKARKEESDKAAFDRAVSDYFEAVKSGDANATLQARENDAIAFKFGGSRTQTYRKAIETCRTLDREHPISDYLDKVASIYSELTGGERTPSWDDGLGANANVVIIGEKQKKKIGY